MPYIIQSGSKQYTVTKGQTIVVDNLAKVDGDIVDLDVVYSYGEEKKQDKIQAKVVSTQKGTKIRVVKYKPKSNYHRQYGYRHTETVLEILETAEVKPKKESKKSTKAEEAKTAESV